MAKRKVDLEYAAQSPRKSSLYTRRFLFATSAGLTCVFFYILLSLTLSAHIPTLSNHFESVGAVSNFESGCSVIRYRQEWRKLSGEEQLEYLNAIKCLQDTPGLYRDDQTLFGDYANIHSHAANAAHDTTLFLPWHRYLLHNFENDLRTHCSFKGTIPYWNWSLDWEALDKAPIWDSTYGVGGNGTGADSVGHGHCVQDGPFANYQALRFGAKEKHHCLSRGFLDGANSTKYSAMLRPEKVDEIMQKDDHYEFWNTLEFAAHEAIPRWIRGEFFEFTSPNDPIFYFHHCQVDRLWTEWQLADPVNRLEQVFAPRPGESTPTVDYYMELDKLGPHMRLGDILRTDGGPLCYRYLT